MIGLTRLQHETFLFISARCEGGIPPTIQEISTWLETKSKGTAHRLVKVLEDRGYIRRIAGKARAIEIVPRAPSVTLNPEINELTTRYATEHGIKIDTAVNELLRSALDAA